MLTTNCTIVFTDPSDVEYRKEITIEDREMRQLLEVPNGSLHEAVQTKGNVVLDAIWKKWLDIEAAVGDIRSVHIAFDYAEMPTSPPIPAQVD